MKQLYVKGYILLGLLIFFTFFSRATEGKDAGCFSLFTDLPTQSVPVLKISEEEVMNQPVYRNGTGGRYLRVIDYMELADQVDPSYTHPLVMMNHFIDQDQSDGAVLSNVKIYPNPYSTDDFLTIQYTLARGGPVTIILMDLLGGEVQRLVEAKVEEEGSQSSRVQLKRDLNKGFYFVRVIAGSYSATARLIVE